MQHLKIILHCFKVSWCVHLVHSRIIMAKSLQRVLFCLLVLASLTKALRILNGDRCLNCAGDMIKDKSVNVLFRPYFHYPITFPPCNPLAGNYNPWQHFWTYTPNKNYKINICILTADACLGVKLRVNEKERRIDGIAVILAPNTTNSKQEWNYDGRKLTNVYMGPTYCAQAEAEGLMMVPCNANEPKQKIDIGK